NCVVNENPPEVACPGLPPPSADHSPIRNCHCVQGSLESFVSSPAQRIDNSSITSNHKAADFFTSTPLLFGNSAGKIIRKVWEVARAPAEHSLRCSSRVLLGIHQPHRCFGNSASLAWLLGFLFALGSLSRPF